MVRLQFGGPSRHPRPQVYNQYHMIDVLIKEVEVYLTLFGYVLDDVGRGFPVHVLKDWNGWLYPVHPTEEQKDVVVVDLHQWLQFIHRCHS